MADWRATRRGHASAIADDVMGRVQKFWGESPFYQARLKGPAPDRLACRPVDPYTADMREGESIARGRFSYGAEAIDCEGEPDLAWGVATKGGVLYGWLHKFAWLRPLSALGEAGRGPARALAGAWLADNEKWSAEAWEPYLTGERLANLCCHASLLLGDADVMWRSRLLTSMARQTRHLERAGHRAAGGYERLMTAMSLSLSALCLPGCEQSAERGLELMRRELRLQMRPDGGHLSRNPSRQLEIVVRLKMVMNALETRRIAAPGFLKHMLSRAAAHAQLFRLGDGRLAVFNGGFEDDGRALVHTLSLVDTDAEPIGFARHSGFQRLESEKSVVIADVGATKSTGLAIDPFQSAASFHLASGKSRLVVNCGAGARLTGEWVAALRQAGAHSTLASDPPSIMSALTRTGAVAHRRAEDARGQLLEIDRFFGAEADAPRHIRRLFLNHAGDALIGEDSLENAPSALAMGWRIRFHLHPAVKASIARDRRSVILALPNSEGWRFRSNCRHLSLERSVYCGGGGLPQATEQIVLSSSGLEAPERSDMVVKWGFRRIDGA